MLTYSGSPFFTHSTFWFFNFPITRILSDGNSVESSYAVFLSEVAASVGSLEEWRTGDDIGAPGDGRPLTPSILTSCGCPPSGVVLVDVVKVASSMGIHRSFIPRISDVIQKTIKSRHAATPIRRLVLMFPGGSTASHSWSKVAVGRGCVYPVTQWAG